MKINGERLRWEMHDQNLSLDDVASALRISVTSVSKWRNEKKDITKAHLYSLARVLNISPASLVKSDEPARVIRCWQCRFYENKVCYNTIVPHPQPDEFWFCSDAKEID